MKEAYDAKIKSIEILKEMIDELKKNGDKNNLKVQFITAFGAIVGDIVDYDDSLAEESTGIVNISFCSNWNPQYFICLKNVIVKTASETKTMPDTVLYIDQIIGFAFAQVAA